MSFFAFQPLAPSVSVAATTTSGSVALGSVSDAARAYTVRIFNDGLVTCFIAFGYSGVTADTTSLPIPAGGVEVFPLGRGSQGASTHIAAVTGSSTTTLRATVGVGE
jgi:hypothetical protein